MGLTEIIAKTKQVEVGLVTLDAAVREIHTSAATVTRHPIEAEQGTQSAVSDNVKVEPDSIQIEGVVTNHPTELIGTFDNSETRDVQAYLELITTLQTGTLIEVKTTLREYFDMVIERVSVTRDKDRGNALYVDLTATNVRLVELEETETSATRPPAQSTKSGGKKAATPADATTDASSTSLLGKLAGLGP